MSESPVFAHPSDGGGERPGEQQLVDVFEGVLGDLVDRGAVVAPVEVAEEVAAVEAVECQQAGGLGEGPQHEAGPVALVEVAARQPRVRGHDVRGDEGVFEVEGGEVPVGGQDLGAQSLRAALAAPFRRLHRCTAGLDHRREVHLGDVAVPVDDPGVEAERRPVCVFDLAPEGHQPVEPVDGLAFGVGAVEVDVAHGPVDELALLLEAGGGHGVSAAHGENVEGLVHPVEHGAGPFELLLDPAPAGERPLGHRYGLAVLVVDGVLGEPFAHQVDELPVAQRVLRP